MYCFQFYTVVACKRGDDDDAEIWQTPETWLEMDYDGVMWAYYPFRNRKSCVVNFVEKNDPVGGKKWDRYKVTTLYFPEVHTTSYNKAEELCREIGERPLTDHSMRPKLLRNAMLAFTVRHALGERNVSEVSFDIRDFGHNRSPLYRSCTIYFSTLVMINCIELTFAAIWTIRF